MKNIRFFFLSEFFMFLEVKFSIYLNRLVFVMINLGDLYCAVGYKTFVNNIKAKKRFFEFSWSYLINPWYRGRMREGVVTWGYLWYGCPSQYFETHPIHITGI